MKIMSLNVNRFIPLGFLEGSKGREIIICIKLFLLNDIDNVVFLQEVPPSLIGELENTLNGKAKEEKKIFEVIKPILDPFRQANAYTVAIKREESKWGRVDEFRQKKREFEKNKEFKDKGNPWYYENKFIEIKNDDLNLQLLGIHAPWQEKVDNNSITVFFNAIEDYAKNKSDHPQRFVIIGDLNADTKETSVYHETLEHIENMRYLLAVKELGDVITQFKYKTRIDHVLVSPALRDEVKVTAQVIPKEVLELSDHAVIIADVNLQPKKT